MQGRNAQAGRAIAVQRARSAYFSDPAWEDRFEKLIKYTQRTSLVVALTGTDATPARIKCYMRQRLEECGIAPNLPRGNPPSYESKAFLKPEDDRLDAAYLAALHYGPRGPGEFSEVEVDLGQALDKRLEVYGRYCCDLYPLKAARQHAPRLGFEDYVVLIQGIQAKVVAMHVCRDCKACHPYSTLQTVTPTCPFCNRLKLDMSAARMELEHRLQQARRLRQQPTAMRQIA